MNLQKKLLIGAVSLAIGGAFITGRMTSREPRVTINYTVPQDVRDPHKEVSGYKTSVTLKASEVSDYLHKNRHFMQDIDISAPRS